MAQIIVQVCWLENKKHWGQEKIYAPVSAVREGVNLSPSTFFFFMLSIDGLMLTHFAKGKTLWLAYQFKCYSILETPSEIHPEIMFNQISGHPLTHSSWHIKLTIAVSGLTNLNVFWFSGLIVSIKRNQDFKDITKNKTLYRRNTKILSWSM